MERADLRAETPEDLLRVEELRRFVRPGLVIDYFGDNDSRLPYTFEARRKGRGWVYRRCWRDGPTDAWRTTSVAFLRVIKRERYADWKRHAAA